MHREQFQSTLPSQGATKKTVISQPIMQFQSTLPSQGATRLRFVTSVVLHFNPRSPHRERPRTSPLVGGAFDFNPRSPHRERPPWVWVIEFERCEFQSTLPSQGATVVVDKIIIFIKFQSTLPSQGATHRDTLNGWVNGISIHAPLTGSDHIYI